MTAVFRVISYFLCREEFIGEQCLTGFFNKAFYRARAKTRIRDTFDFCLNYLMCERKSDTVFSEPLLDFVELELRNFYKPRHGKWFEDQNCIKAVYEFKSECASECRHDFSLHKVIADITLATLECFENLRDRRI